MPGSVRVARLFGIDLRIHLSWIVIFLLVVLTLVDSFPQDYPFWSNEKTFIVAGVAALLFFASVVAHELAHAIVARAFRMEVSSITLFLLGGVANLTREPGSARAELFMAAAGPLTSLVIGAVAIGVASVVDAPALQPLQAVAGYLGPVNVVLAIFNLLPGFPLDGGRVFRALVWMVSRDRHVATRVAARGGQLMAALLAVGGAYVVLRLQDTFGTWYFLIAYFLWNAATTALAQERAAVALGDARVSDVMTKQFAAADPAMTVAQLVHDIVLPSSRRAVPVARGGRLIGMVTTADVRGVPQDRWASTLVANVMRSASDLPTLLPTDLLGEAIERFAAADLPSLPVLEGEALVGVLEAEALENHLRMREMLGQSR